MEVEQSIESEDKHCVTSTQEMSSAREIVCAPRRMSGQQVTGALSMVKTEFKWLLPIIKQYTFNGETDQSRLDHLDASAEHTGDAEALQKELLQLQSMTKEALELFHNGVRKLDEKVNELISTVESVSPSSSKSNDAQVSCSFLHIS